MRNVNNMSDDTIHHTIELLIGMSQRYSDMPRSTNCEHFEWEFGSHVWKRLPCIYGEGTIIHDPSFGVCAFYGIPVRFNNNNPNCLKLWRRV